MFDPGVEGIISQKSMFIDIKTQREIIRGFKALIPIRLISTIITTAAINAICVFATSKIENSTIIG